MQYCLYCNKEINVNAWWRIGWTRRRYCSNACKMKATIESDLRTEPQRKIPVASLSWNPHGEESYSYEVQFVPGSQGTHRKEFAALRKAVKAYKTINSEAYRWQHHTTGEQWRLHEDVIRRFSDWLAVQEPLETLMKRAVDEGVARQQEKQRREAEEDRQHERELREKRTPCPSPCRVRVLEIICKGEARMPYFHYHSKIKKPYTYMLLLDQGTTPQSRNAFERLCITLATRQMEQGTLHVQGAGPEWTFHEYDLLEFSDWLVFPEHPGDIDTILQRAQEELNARQESARREWSEQFNGSSRITALLRAEVKEALDLFGLDLREEIKKRYRQLAMQHHPDTGGDIEQMKRINEANEVLSDWADEIHNQ